jgi:hypothetical protein
MFGVGVGVRVGGFTPVSSGGGFDPDAQAFFDRVTTAGGTLSETEKTATNQLVLDMKTAGIWSAMIAIYPMVGASAAACAQNLKSSSFTGTFTSGWTFASTGITGNNVSAYMNTGLVPNTQFATANDGNFGYYTRTNLAVNKTAMGCDDSNRYFIDYPLASSVYPSINDPNTAIIATGLDKGFRQISRNSSNLSQILYLKNTTSYTVSQASTNKSTKSIYIGASNANYYSNYEIAFAYVGNTQLTTTNQADFYTAVQAFQTTLSRQV